MPRPDVSEERTNQIIEAAVKVFAERGIGKARMDDIAQETGVSKGTLYLYFKSKDAIISTILEAFLGRELAQARAVMDAPLAPTDKLHQIARMMVEDLKKIKPLLSLYFELMALTMRHEMVRDVITNSFSEFIEIVEIIIQQGMRRLRLGRSSRARYCYGFITLNGLILKGMSIRALILC
jgi:AcrR family transcriptional regulator